MALIVENGTGLPTAESYASVGAFKTYCDARGLSYEGKSDAEIEQALRRATSWLDATYGSRWNGYRVTLDQALVWPMSGLVDRGGYSIAFNSVPRQVIAATIEAAVRELAEPGSLAPDVVPGETLKRIKAGSVELEYSGTGAGSSAMAPVLSVVDGLLAPLFIARTSRFSGRAVRA